VLLLQVELQARAQEQLEQLVLQLEPLLVLQPQELAQLESQRLEQVLPEPEFRQRPEQGLLAQKLLHRQ
jgi:hypothetical protein